MVAARIAEGEMFRRMAAILVTALWAAAAAAATHWNGPGWYQVEDGDFTRRRTLRLRLLGNSAGLGRLI
jgi:hypothetical protein